MKHAPGNNAKRIESRKAAWMILTAILTAVALFPLSGNGASSKADVIRPVADYALEANALEASALEASAPPDAQSTSGPIPPTRTSADGIDIASTTATTKTIAGVPSYLWRHGCGPTAAGMVIGYWDGHGYDTLVPGNAFIQTTAVDAMIASGDSDGDLGTNYADYCYPKDYYPNLLSDLSEPPIGDEHPDHCVADYMKTSQSYHGNYYGWSWFSHMGPALADYTRQALGGDYFAITENLYMPWDGSLNWDRLRAEIDAGRPMVFLVDTDGDGGTDHFVTVIGYGVIDDVQHYACLTTWAGWGIRWYEFAPIEQGQPWGIFGGITYKIMLLDQHMFLPIIHATMGTVGDGR